MTVTEAYFGGKKMVPADNTEMLSASVSTMIIEGIAQNTSGSIFEPEVSQDLYFISL
jgi:Ca2+-transporting ATPase